MIKNKKVLIVTTILISFVLTWETVSYYFSYRIPEVAPKIINKTEEPEEEININIPSDIVIAFPKVYEISEIENYMIYQNPELPTGCEVTTLTMNLNYLGFNIDKCILSDLYLPKGQIGTVTPYQAFIGNPRSSHSFGCYSPVIVETTNNYFYSINYTEKQTYDTTGTEFKKLISDYIINDIPVMIWGTIHLVNTYNTVSWNINGEVFTWKAEEHCMLLVGFDEENYIILDPLYGIKRYPKYLVEDRYKQMGSQSVVIY